MFKLSLAFEKPDHASNLFQKFSVGWKNLRYGDFNAKEIQLIISLMQTNFERWNILVKWSKTFADWESKLITVLAATSENFKFNRQQYEQLVQPVINDIGENQPHYYEELKRFMLPDESLHPISTILNYSAFKYISKYVVKKEKDYIPSLDEKSMESDAFSYSSKPKMFGKRVTVKWKLLFRASEHEFSAQAFHQYCDDKGPTITLVKDQSGQKVVGYAGVSWESDVERESWITNPNGFIVHFNQAGDVFLSDSYRSRISSFCFSGPSLSNNEFSMIVTNKCNLDGTASSLKFGHRNENMKVLEYEVYGVDVV